MFLNYFPNIKIRDYDDLPVLQKRNTNGQVFSLLRYGIYRDDIKHGGIYKTPWDTLCQCYHVIRSYSHEESKESSIYIASKKRQDLYEQYGPYTLNLFMPVCGIFFCSKREKYSNIDNKYYEPGIVYKNKLYLYKPDIKDRLKLDLDLTDYFDTDPERPLVFTHITPDPDLINIVFTLDITPIQFVLGATRFIKFFDALWNRRPGPYEYPEIDSVYKLYQLLSTSKSHSMQYIFGD